MACTRALHMPDILTVLFDQMPCHKGTYNGLTGGEAVLYESNRQTVARLARVCKAFTNLALQSLWRTLDSMKPLFRLLSCFKQVVVEIEGSVRSDSDSDGEYEERFVWVLQGDVCPIEWERFRQYAKRVRSLRHHYGHAIDPSVLYFLSYCQQRAPILPQLRKLDWSQLSGEDVTLFPFISPSLRRLSLQFCDGGGCGRPTRRQCVLESILCYILSRAPALESLSVHRLPQASLVLSLAAWHHLHRLHLHDAVQILDAHSFNVLAEMANLSDLHIIIGYVEHMPVPLPAGFRKLKSLSLQGGHRTILFFLQAISPPLLHSISLKYRDIRGPGGRNDILEPGSYLKVTTSLALCTKFTALRRLIVQCTPWVPRLHSESAAFTFIDLIRPLFVMKQLEEIHFQFEKLAMHLPDMDFDELVFAWPRMKAFTLHCSIHQVALPSMSALVTFARRCPDLKRLALPSIGDGAFDTLLPEAFPLTSHGLHELTFQERPGIADRDTLIPTVHRLFPSLDRTSGLHSFCRSFAPNNM